jgi:hypothetical protein
MKVMLKDVRIAFPQVFEAKAVNDGPEKFSAAFLFPPEHPAVPALKKAMADIARAKWGEKAAEVYKSLQANDRLALHDGDRKADYAGYAGMMFVNASNDLRPTVLDGGKRPLAAADGKIYAGCYVNGLVELWAQDNRFGKRINASLLGVQFVRDGERLAGGTVATEDDFEALPEAEGAGAFEEPQDALFG